MMMMMNTLDIINSFRNYRSVSGAHFHDEREIRESGKVTASVGKDKSLGHYQGHYEINYYFFL